MDHLLHWDLSETPGIYYSLTYGLSALLFISLNRQKTDRSRYALFALCWGAQMLFAFLTYRIPQQIFLLCVLVEVLLIYAMIRSCCDMDTRTCSYYTLRAYMVGEFAASLEWQLLYYAVAVLGKPFDLPLNLFLLAVTHTVTFSVIRKLERRFAGDSRDLEITWKEVRNVFLITVVIYAISNISYALRNTPFSSRWTMEIYTIRTLADLGGIAILFGYHMVLHELHTKKEADQLQAALDRQYVHYQASREAMDLVNRKYHDLKHQILYLKSGITEEQRLSMLNEMEAEVSVYESLSRTGHPMVDTILTEKGLRCREQGITFKAIADGNAMAFLSPAEICSLLGNALDNAIEAAEQLEDPKLRVIRLNIEKKKRFLLFSVENRFAQGPVYADPAGEQSDGGESSGLPVTTKADRGEHGFGLRSIESIAHAHDGSLQVSTNSGWFRLQVLIPLPAEEKGDGNAA